jgi:hypothetical protein
MTLKTKDSEAFNRLLDFVGKRIMRSEMVKTVDVHRIEEPRAEAGDERLLSLVEMALPRTRPGGDYQDHLGVIIKMANPLDPTRTNFFSTFDVLLPEILRSVRRETATTVYVNDLLIAGETHETEVVAAVIYALRRDRRADSILGDLQRFAEVLKQTADAERVLSLAQAIIDRIEVLEEAGDAEIVLSGSLSGFGSGKAGADSAHYMALVGGEVEAAQGQWWVRGSNLQIGDSAETAVPVAGSSHLLLRYGPRSTQQGVRRFIEELRRRHTMRREELQTTEEGENYESYVENEVERRRKSAIDAIYGEHKMLPMVTPVAVEFASELGSQIALGTDPTTSFQKRINAMQETIKSSYGVGIPNPRLRANNTDMPAGSYLFMLNEIPIVMGTVNSGKHFCDATVEQLRKIGIAADPATNPADGSESAFIASKEAEAAGTHGFRTRGPGEYVALHLEGLLRKNLTLFLGTDDIAAELNAPDAQGVLDQLRSMRGGIARFRTVVQALLCEGLPARPLPLLARRYIELADQPAYQIAEAFRLLEPIHQHLVKDITKWQTFSLSSEFVDLIGRHIVRDGDAALLTLETMDNTYPLTSAVRTAMTGDGNDVPVILVEDWLIRPFVRKLLELEFPGLRAVAKREVDRFAPGELEPIEEISLE